MTKSELIAMLDGFPDDYDVAIDIGEDELFEICFADSCVLRLENGEEVFMLAPCFCEDEDEEFPIGDISLN